MWRNLTRCPPNCCDASKENNDETGYQTLRGPVAYFSTRDRAPTWHRKEERRYVQAETAKDPHTNRHVVKGSPSPVYPIMFWPSKGQRFDPEGVLALNSWLSAPSLGQKENIKRLTTEPLGSKLAHIVFASPPRPSFPLIHIWN